MAESYGWAGKILRVNLTTGEITTQDDEKYHKYIGGMGMAYRIMYEEAPMEWLKPMAGQARSCAST